MFQRKPRRFRRRPSDRNQPLHMNGYNQGRPRLNPFSSNHTRNNLRATLSAEKLFEKYNTLAKEALSSGDETTYENYLQHADHFVRIIEDKNKNKNLSKTNISDKSAADNNHSPENSDTKLKDVTKNKE